MALIGNNGSGKTDWYGSFGSILEKAFTGDVFEGLNVTAQGTPNMTVQVNPGTAKITTGSVPSKQSYLVRLDTSGGVSATISTANGSNPRRDLVVGYYKTAVIDATNPNNPGALRFVVVAGTPAASPSDPNASAIQSAISGDGGSASDPYIILARVTVPAAATQITSSNITDLRTLASPAYLADASVKNSKLDTSVGELGGSWQPWTPTWTSNGTAPAIGNGTLTGAYLKVGKTVHFRIKFVGGSTTTWGTGNYFISLPVAAYSSIAANDSFALNGYVEDAGVAGWAVNCARMFDTTKFYVMMSRPQDTVFNPWAATNPFTWGAGDYWSATGFYEAA